MSGITRARTLRRELDVRGRIPYTAHVANHVARTNFGDYVQVIRLDGASFESADAEQLNGWHERLSILWRDLASPSLAIWTHVVRHRMPPLADDGRQRGFADRLRSRYLGRLAGGALMINELFLSLVYRPAAGLVAGLAAQALARTQRESSRLELQEALDACEKLAQTVEASLVRYEPLRLVADEGCLDSLRELLTRIERLLELQA